jgi:uncharacterized MAPEG superfamily protein
MANKETQMKELLENPAFRTYCISSSILVLNLLVLAGATGGVRGSKKSLLNPEDPGYTGEPENEAVTRIRNAHRNAMENIVPFFAIGLLYVLTGGTALGATLYFGIFTGARVLHSIAYLAAKQPWRTIFFVIGALATLGMVVQVLMRTLS